MNSTEVTTLLSKIVYPNAMLVVVMAVAISFDFLLGVAKSRLNGIEITSSGYRESFKKIFQYVGTYLAVLLLLNLCSVGTDAIDALWMAALANAIMVGMIINEILSIIENSIAIAPDSSFSKYLRMAHAVLTLKMFEKLKKLQDETTKKENNSSDTV